MNELKSPMQLVFVRLPEDLIAAVDDYAARLRREEQGSRVTRSDAFRRLLYQALGAEAHVQGDGKGGENGMADNEILIDVQGPVKLVVSREDREVILQQLVAAKERSDLDQANHVIARYPSTHRDHIFRKTEFDVRFARALCTMGPGPWDPARPFLRVLDWDRLCSHCWAAYQKAVPR